MAKKEIAKTEQTTTALALVGETEYSILKIDPAETGAIMAKNIGDAGLDVYSLDRVAMPAGGGQMWSVPTLDGDEPVQYIEGVIISWQDCRAFYPTAYDGSKNPPACSSRDTKIGIGDPGGECVKCPYAQWGSATAPDGTAARGQACSEKRQLFILTPDSILPMLITLPPTSLGVARKYFMRLAAKSLAYHSVVTRIGLTTDKSGTGIDYSAATFTVASRLSADQVTAFDKLNLMFEPQLEGVAITNEADSGAGVQVDAVDAGETNEEPAAVEEPAEAGTVDVDLSVNATDNAEPPAEEEN